MSATKTHKQFSQTSMGLHKRNANTSDHQPLMSPPSKPSDSNYPTLRSGRLIASTLLQSSPSHHGKVHKLHIPIFYALAPFWMKRILHFISKFSPHEGLRDCLIPSWKERHLILIGKYLYRFQSDKNAPTNASSSKLKHNGCPLPIKTMQAKTLSHRNHDRNNEIHFDQVSALTTHLPSFCDGYWTVTSQDKTHYYAVSTPQEAQVWVHSIQERRQEVITQELGHSPMTYPEVWKHIDDLGRKKWESKQRIKTMIERQQRREMELVAMGDGIGSGAGGPMPSGYYG